MPPSGVSHVGLTVTDLNRSCAWYAEVLGWKELLRDRGDTTSFAHGVLPGGLSLVLREHDQRVVEPFDEKRPGLDHLSFSVETEADLDELEKNLTAVGASFTPKRELPYGWLLTFRDPDNIALEVMLGR
ncbi:VOC family protein [Pseudofrankia asymbiotica]|uniref:Glyoxalase n=1 Tax=Pseudofrankia asymbiotica TaxID=1834516 RepID=A0A1V2I7B6_9ACTN|nr:VOC family protein [Pseudofrankia asymbiotica]ONH27740.1 glyoxalase [Pseudofrankia asymbiotica]